MKTKRVLKPWVKLAIKILPILIVILLFIIIEIDIRGIKTTSITIESGCYCG